MWEKLNSVVAVSFIREEALVWIALTTMVKVLTLAHVSVAPRRNVEITLHLVQIQAAKNATTIRLPPKLRRLCPLGLLPTQRNNIVDMLLPKALLIIPELQPTLVRVDLALAVPPELVDALGVHPLAPVGRIAMQTLLRHDAVASGVLDVDVDVVARHLDHDVEVDLEFVGDFLLDGEFVGFAAAPPAGDFGPDEEDGDDGHGDGPFAAARGARYILGF